MMERPFPKSTPFEEKYSQLLDVVNNSDSLGVLIHADPDSMASALALKRIFWRKAKAIKVYRINTIKRADNLAFIKLLKFPLEHFRNRKRFEITKWVLVDSQPHHHKRFMDRRYSIIIDHHPCTDPIKAEFIDIQENFGANSSIMTEYLRAGRIKPSPRLATALFYGIKTDTYNFVRATLPHDMDAFKFLYQFTDFSILKKIEMSQMTKRMVISYRRAMERLVFFKDVAFVHMERVANPDLLVLIADFFMKIAEIRWSIVSGVYKKTLIVILRNASFEGDAGRTARQMFRGWGGHAGGHRNAARAEIPLEAILGERKGESDLESLIKKLLKKRIDANQTKRKS